MSPCGPACRRSRRWRERRMWRSHLFLPRQGMYCERGLYIFVMNTYAHTHTPDPVAWCWRGLGTIPSPLWTKSTPCPTGTSVSWTDSPLVGGALGASTSLGRQMCMDWTWMLWVRNQQNTSFEPAKLVYSSSCLGLLHISSLPYQSLSASRKWACTPTMPTSHRSARA